jgi:hypothetical protein
VVTVGVASARRFQRRRTRPQPSHLAVKLGEALRAGRLGQALLVATRGAVVRREKQVE